MDGEKLITLDNLDRYHLNLADKLRLVEGTMGYSYQGSRTDFPEGIDSVGAMLDFLYDLSKHKDGTVSVTGNDFSMDVDNEDGFSYDLNLQSPGETEVKDLFKDCDDPVPDPEPEGEPEWIER